MTVAAIQSSPSQPLASPASTAPADRQTLRALLKMGRQLDNDSPVMVREACAQMVSELFFKPMLAQMREFPIGTRFASGGHGEKIFAQYLDEQIADTVAAADSSGLVTRLTRELQGQDETTSAPTAPLSWHTCLQAQPVSETCNDE
ncbi:MAG: hypothetical protein ABIG44_10730 [Planctomycetota bacterium]